MINNKITKWIGMNVYRIPFLWERMQPVPGGPLASQYLQGLQTLVTYLTNNSRYLFSPLLFCHHLLLIDVVVRYSVIDPHNYGRGFGGIVGESATAISLYADLWYRLAMEFKDNNWVILLSLSLLLPLSSPPLDPLLLPLTKTNGLNGQVIFGLMNEPNNQDVHVWEKAAQVSFIPPPLFAFSPLLSLSLLLSSSFLFSPSLPLLFPLSSLLILQYL